MSTASSTPTALAELLQNKGFALLDGAMGTELFARGLTSGDCPELWNVDYPERVVDVHNAYMDAGSDIVLTNTFGGSRFRLALHNLSDRTEELNAAGARIAKEAARSHPRDVVVGGSMGQTGELMQPLGERTHDEMVEAFSEQARGLAAGGVDLIWIETMSSLDEIRAAVAGAKLGAPDLPIVTTVSFDTNGRSMMGVTSLELAALAAELDVLAFGANCGATVSETEKAVTDALGGAGARLVVSKANAGIPEWSDGALRYTGSPEVMAAHAIRMRDAGVVLIGACCGSSPAHLAMMRQALDGDISVPDIPAPGPVISDAEPSERRGANRRRRRS